MVLIQGIFKVEHPLTEKKKKSEMKKSRQATVFIPKIQTESPLHVNQISGIKYRGVSFYLK